MAHPIMIGCDFHDKNMVLCIARGRQEPVVQVVANAPEEREALIRDVKEQARIARTKVVFAYEASSLGFGLYDQLTQAGVRCWVLAPTNMERSQKQKRSKTDGKDALKILELLRGHLLAGNSLPSIWVPDPQIRDDRDLVRARLDIGIKIARIKSQVRMLLKRLEQRPPRKMTAWCNPHRNWLHGLCQPESGLLPGSRQSLASLLRQLHHLEEEQRFLDERVQELAHERRYSPAVCNLIAMCGISLLSAMVFLVEIGDPKRFRNRRQIGAYLGLVPSTQESGDKDDCKGHITHQGPARIRRVLCQATWARVRHDDKTRVFYERLVRRNPKRKKIAVVAAMRKLGIIMWHVACDAYEQDWPDTNLEGVVDLSGTQSADPPPLPPLPKTRRSKASPEPTGKTVNA